MKPFQDLPIRRKMLVMNLGICGAVLFVAVVLLIVFQIFNFRSNFQRDTATLSAIIANNSTAALAFGDHEAAGEILASLKAKPTVISACLADSAGTTVAQYGKESAPTARHEFPPEHQFLYRGGHLFYTQAVELGGKHVGDFCLCVNYRSVLGELLRFDAMVMAGVILVSILLAASLTGRMQKLIAGPVLSLAETSRQVGERNDYSVRSSLDGRGDELGALAKAFNHMLSRIHAQDADLTRSQQKLESLVNSLDGIVWEWNPHQSRYTFVSRQSARILGYEPEEWLANPNFWDAVLHPEDRARATAVRVEAMKSQQPFNHEYRMTSATGRVLWIRESGMALVEDGQVLNLRGIFQDITQQKDNAAQLNQLNRQLIDASRQAGMAEVATGVLHNVGNVLNSVNVSAHLLRDQLTRSHLPTLLKTTELLREHAGDAAAFLTQDPRGIRLPGFLVKLGEHLSGEQREFEKELNNLAKNIEHIKEIVAMQQGYARVGGLMEIVDARELVDDALRLNEISLLRQSIRLERRFSDRVPVAVDKHKGLQILVNLIRNAIQAMALAEKEEKILTLVIQPAGTGRVQIRVCDNGAGVPSENLTRIFQHGFTTKADGHGFGLHSSANAAREMGGLLSVHSDGPGRGAAFTLELPAADGEISCPLPRIPQPQHN